MMDWREIRRKFEDLPGGKKIILTTEKDAVRLMKFEAELGGMPFYVIPIEHRFLFHEGILFDHIVINFIQQFKVLQNG
jgi:tetraacyldisaccharide 4'-kinase